MALELLKNANIAASMVLPGANGRECKLRCIIPNARYSTFYRCLFVCACTHFCPHRMPGHRHGDCDGQERPVCVDIPGGPPPPVTWHPRRIHPNKPPLLPGLSRALLLFSVIASEIKKHVSAFLAFFSGFVLFAFSRNKYACSDTGVVLSHAVSD